MSELCGESHIICLLILFTWAQWCLTLCDPVDYVAHQAPLSMGFSNQEHWSGLPFPPPQDLPDPETEPTSAASPALAGEFSPTEPPGKPLSHLVSPIISVLHSRSARAPFHEPVLVRYG